MRWNSRLSMTTRPSLRADRIAAAGGRGRRLALILGALGFQYIGGIAPCEMCHWQRWAHIAAAIIGHCRRWRWRSAIKARGAGLDRDRCWSLMSGLIGAYQTGMQWHLLPGPAACSGHRYVLGSNMPPPEVQCDVVTWQLFGLSLAAYNASSPS